MPDQLRGTYPSLMPLSESQIFELAYGGRPDVPPGLREYWQEEVRQILARRAAQEELDAERRRLLNRMALRPLEEDIEEKAYQRERRRQQEAFETELERARRKAEQEAMTELQPMVASALQARAERQAIPAAITAEAGLMGQEERAQADIEAAVVRAIQGDREGLMRYNSELLRTIGELMGRPVYSGGRIDPELQAEGLRLFIDMLRQSGVPVHPSLQSAIPTITAPSGLPPRTGLGWGTEQPVGPLSGLTAARPRR